MIPRSAAFALTLAAMAVSLGCARDSGELMSWQEYRDIRVEWPYPLSFQTDDGALLYFGARHTFAPEDPQLAEIERLWSCFRPTIAFNEGGDPPLEASRDAAVEMHGEPGLVRFLAARDDVPVASLDPDRGEEVARLRRLFSAREVKLFFLLRSVAQVGARQGPEGVDDEIRRVLDIYNARPGLGGPPRTVAEVANEFARSFPGEGDYRGAPLSWFDPTLSETYLNRMSRAASEYRDRSMVSLLSGHVRAGQRVFAVVGGSHVVMQEGALTALLGVRADRQPLRCR